MEGNRLQPVNHPAGGAGYAPQAALTRAPRCPGDC